MRTFLRLCHLLTILGVRLCLTDGEAKPRVPSIKYGAGKPFHTEGVKPQKSGSVVARLPDFVCDSLCSEGARQTVVNRYCFSSSNRLSVSRMRFVFEEAVIFTGNSRWDF